MVYGSIISAGAGLNFGALPPEINSQLMYLGPGSGPLIAAAAAWDALAGELSIAASGYASISSELTGTSWLGPTSVAMAAAVTPFVAWLNETAGSAAETAGQAKAAAAAYELAFTMTVPPPVIAANRSLLLALVATNFFGQNAAAIAAAEAHYTQMWLQDATAMYLYAESSAAASQLASFTEPPPTTTPGTATQAGAVTHAAGSAAATQSTTLSQLLSTMPGAAATAPDPLSASTLLITGMSATKIVNTVISTTSAATSGRGVLIVDERLAVQEAKDAEAAAALRFMSTSDVGRAGTMVSAGMSRATLVGKLSVPAGWATAAPEIRTLALTLPDAGIASTAPTGMPAAPGSVFNQSVLGMLSRHGSDPPRAKSKAVIVRSPAAG